MFLQNDKNKQALISLYSNHMVENCKAVLKPGQDLFINGGHDDKTIICQSEGESEVVESFWSNEEEAGTRIILHAINAA